MENENEKQDARDREEEEEWVTWTIEKYREKGQGKANQPHSHKL